MYYERLMSMAGLEKRAYPQNGYGINGQQNPPGAPTVRNWTPGTWNARTGGQAGYSTGKAVGDAIGATGDVLSKGWYGTKKFFGAAGDAIGSGIASGVGTVAGWYDNTINRGLEAAYDFTRGTYRGLKTSRPGWQSPEEIESQRRTDAQRKADESLARHQQQQKEQSDKFNAEWNAQSQAAKDGLAQSQAKYDAQQKYQADMAAWKQADPEAYGRYVDEKYKAGYMGAKPGTPEWEASQKFSRDALAKWQATQTPAMQQIQNNINLTQNPSLQTKVAPAAGAPQVQQPAGTQTPQASQTPQMPATPSQPAQQTPAARQIQNNINSTQNPSFQTKVAPSSGAPTVQQPQTPKSTANTNYQDPGRWNNNRPTGRQGY